MLVGGFYCYKLDFVPFVCTAFDMLEIGAEIEYAILSKLVCNVLNFLAKCTRVLDFNVLSHLDVNNHA